MESKLQELEERLRSEEREKTSIMASQRRTERKLKELNATLDQERSQHVEQRDQLTLRVKALKRQVDESELEVERLEGVRRKVLRDFEEQQELQEALQAKVSALESELKRKGLSTHRSAIGSTLSSEDEDSFYDTSLTSILNESHLQTSNCWRKGHFCKILTNKRHSRLNTHLIFCSSRVSHCNYFHCTVLCSTVVLNVFFHWGISACTFMQN